LAVAHGSWPVVAGDNSTPDINPNFYPRAEIASE
jgi:hypothetical protein